MTGTSVETHPTLAEAARALSSGGAYLGGGTIVMRDINVGIAPERIIRSTDPALTRFTVAGDTLSLGAGVTMTRLLAQPELAFLHPVARGVGGPQVRNMATVGGNLFSHHPYGDLTVALLALDARVTMAGHGGARPLEDVLRDRTQAGLVASVEVNRPRDGTFGFVKVSRVKPKGVAVLTVAALLPRESGRVRGARVTWGGMAPSPLRGSSVERVLEGQTLDAGTARRAVEVAAEGLDPPTDALATSWYRREVAGVHLGRLLAALERGS
ncbi:MAG: FAD binding domain-containing protein [Pseudomonadota bacterium]